jgi:branched-chain amino acid transport system substrate-binding protein
MAAGPAKWLRARTQAHRFALPRKLRRRREEMMSAKVSDAALTQRARDPYKIGICMEFAGGTRLIQDFYDAIRLVGDEYFERGELDRPVEFVIREVMGPMRGTNPVVVEAWRDLAFTENCLAIIGPEVTEANLAILDLVNSSGVPTISFCATADWAGPYAYALQNGCFPDESNLLAAYMAKQGLKRVGVFHEEGIIGDEYLAAFRMAARRYGVQVVSDHVVGLFNTQEPVEPQLAQLMQAEPDCILVLSAYGALPAVQTAIQKANLADGRTLQLFQNTTWVGITAFGTAGDFDKAAMIRDFEGWIGVDQIHERNNTFQTMLDRFEVKYGRRPFHAYTALGFDHGLVVADTLARMKPQSPEGFRHALERLRMRPACIGAPGTMISFGPQDHRGYKGEYIVLRTIRNGQEQLVDVPWSDLLQTEPRQLGAESATVETSAIAGKGSRYALTGSRTPHRVGLLQDWALWAPLADWYDALKLAFTEAYESGLVDRPIELVVREVEGPPDRSSAPVVKAWRELAEKEQVLGVIGPFITDMTQIIRPLAEQYKVPTISYCATMAFQGEYCFAVPNGTFADETYVMARHLAEERNVRSVGIIREDNHIGDEYFDWFRQHARRVGLNIASDQIISPRAEIEDARAALEQIRTSGSESIIYLGYGIACYRVFAAMRQMVEQGWDVPRATITTWVLVSGMDQPRGSPALMGLPAPSKDIEGWAGVDCLDEANPAWRAFARRYSARFGGDQPVNCYPAHMYDIGRLVAEGISRARPVTPQGLKRGLEQVRMLPAVAGGPGNVISVGPHDHRAYKGAEYLVVRTVQQGREGSWASLKERARC